MKQLYLWILLLFACGNVFAQNTMVQYEYWVDNAYASKVQTNISPVQTFTWQTTIPCQNLDVGLHVLNARFKGNGGQWSPTVSSYFYKMPLPKDDNTIGTYEYWIDNETRTTQTISPAAQYAFSQNIGLGNLPAGLHSMNVRFKDAKGQWSSTVSNYFYKTPTPKDDNAIVAYEYWLDDQFAGRSKVNAATSPVFNLSAAIPFNNLESGLHTFNIRFMDKYGQWSSTESRYFQKLVDRSQNTMVAYEYWINDFYNDKKTGSINNLQSFVILDDIDVSKAVKATNYIRYRFKDAMGNWSSVLSQDFYRPVEPAFSAIVGLSEATFTNTTKYADTYEWDFGDGVMSEQVNPMHTYAEPGAYEVKLIVSNKAFTDSVTQYVEIDGIKKISNNIGGNGGYASFDIYGGGLDEKTVVKLVNGSETISTYRVYKKEPGIICATFDLTGKNVGDYYAWLSQTSETSGKFEGQKGNTCKFFVVATDNVGNTESFKSDAELTVSLNATAIKPVAGDKVHLKVIPNPVESKAIIEFYSKQAENVSLSISNIAGQKVKDLYSGTVKAGVNQIPFESGKMNTGVYFITLKSGDSKETIKVVIK